MHDLLRAAVRAAVVALLTAVASAPLSAAAAEGADDAPSRAKYESLFGAKEKSAAASSATRDDAQFAAELMKAAGSLEDEPGVVRILREKAFEFGSRDAEGYASALAAAKALRESAGDDAAGVATWDGKLAELYRAQYRRAKGDQRRDAGMFLVGGLRAAGDGQMAAHKYTEAVATYKEAQQIAATLRDPAVGELKEKVKAATERKAALEKIEKQKAAVGNDPAKANAVAMAYLLDVDDPASAAEFALKGNDEVASRMIALAVKSLDTVGQPELLELGEWYAGLATPDAAIARRTVALSKAERCLTAYVKAHKDQDAERLRASVKLEAVNKAQLDLAGATGTYTADRLVVWNTRNGTYKDRGATSINVLLISHGESVWSKRDVKIPWAGDTDTNVGVSLPKVVFDTVRVEVVTWQKLGGGLAEVEVFRGQKNLARGAKVTASASIDAVSAPPSTLTDGKTSSAKVLEGYWILPNSSAGWVEVQLSAK